MSEPVTEPTRQAPEAAQPEPVEAKTPPELDGPYDADRALEKIRKANAEAEGLRRRIKELEPAAAQFHALEEASKSENQRLQEAATAAQRQAEDAQSEAVRLRIAMKHGLTEADFDLLGSGTEEQIAARAQRVAELRSAATSAATAAPTPAPGQRPVEQLRPGATPTGTKTDDELNYEKLFGANAP